jgi:GNAT superfamily N-acetyltransferase
MSACIRTRQPADLPACVDVLARVHAAGGYPTNWPADPARWLTPPDLIEAWIASVDGAAVAGHMVITRAAGCAVAEVGRLFVDPAVRRQGIAHALVRHATEWAVAQGADLTLWVTDHLRAAQALYERAGFERAATAVADWTAPDGQPVTVHRYDWRGA